MNIPEGTKLGILTEGSGNMVKDIHMGRPLTIGPIKGFPVWESGSWLKILFLIPIHLSDWTVTKSNRLQGGAFLLSPGEGFAIKSPCQGETHYRFKPRSAVEVFPEKNTFCGFCRTPLGGSRMACLVLTPTKPMVGKILCSHCAKAWEVFAETEGESSLM